MVGPSGTQAQSLVLINKNNAVPLPDPDDRLKDEDGKTAQDLCAKSADMVEVFKTEGKGKKKVVRRAVDARLREMRRAFVRGEPIRAPREVPRCALAFAIVSVVSHWNEFLWPLMVIS